MEEILCRELSNFVQQSPLNRFPQGEEPYFEAPLIGFAAADDTLFNDYKQIIGEFHQTPHEVMQSVLGPIAKAATVISWVLPITAPIRKCNRQENLYPSRAWAMNRCYGEQFNLELHSHMVSWLEKQGHRAVIPQLAPGFKIIEDAVVGRASNWSERHAAYAAGLGTFSLSDALITPKGIAHRLGSIITDLRLKPTPRSYPHFRYNCLYYRNGSCGVCIKRCPARALSEDGHDKQLCRTHIYETSAAEIEQRFGIKTGACGLCQTGVPCESRIP